MRISLFTLISNLRKNEEIYYKATGFPIADVRG